MQQHIYSLLHITKIQVLVTNTKQKEKTTLKIETSFKRTAGLVMFPELNFLSYVTMKIRLLSMNYNAIKDVWQLTAFETVDKNNSPWFHLLPSDMAIF